MVSHAFDWEADSCEIQITIQNSFSDHLNQFFESASYPVSRILVQQLIPSGWVCIWASKFTSLWGFCETFRKLHDSSDLLVACLFFTVNVIILF